MLERLAGGVPVIAVSARPDSPLVRAADAWLPLGPEVDTAVSTLGYTATLQTLGLLTDALLGRTGDWDTLPERVEATLARLTPHALARPATKRLGRNRIRRGVGNGQRKAHLVTHLAK